ncbi:hypothetical protein ACTOB_002542 [Actinoplanes oblitus]|uniref:Uncharacterized protein n=1 Tax=Actinoplanes oblitus TaxID=3040509 RepID=A0ABY8WM50_9ACTN|nr:hypothetical protein [Actinoplanes oblitus]WIM98920.1 hypothetical protein ACTOB_002542 [Actinoplanes oblitus]
MDETAAGQDPGTSPIRATGPTAAAIGLLGLLVAGAGFGLALRHAGTTATEILAATGIGAGTLATAAAVLGGLRALTRPRSVASTVTAGALSVAGLVLIVASGLVTALDRPAPVTADGPRISAQTTGKGDPGGVTVQVVTPGLSPGQPMDVLLTGYAFDGSSFALGRSLSPAGADGVARTALAATTENEKITVEVLTKGRICSQDLPLSDPDAAIPALRCRDN